MHRRDPAGPLLGRAGHKGLAPSGNAYVCKSQEAEASHVEGCWVPLAGALGLGHTPHPRGPDTSPAAPLASRSSSLLPPQPCFPTHDLHMSRVTGGFAVRGLSCPPFPLPCVISKGTSMCPRLVGLTVQPLPLTQEE